MKKEDTEKLQSIYGIINYCASSKDFLEEYSPVNGLNMYSFESIDNSFRNGFLIKVEENKSCIDVKLGMKPYFNMRSYLDPQTKSVLSSHLIMPTISNIYGVKILLGFVKDVIGEYFEAYILIGRDEKYSCLNICLSDIFCISNAVQFPIYINNHVIDKRRLDYEDIMKQIQFSEKDREYGK